MPQFVRLVNTDLDRPFDFHHNNIKKIVPGGGDTIVPWDIACTLFGNPTLVDTTRDPARALSLKQARGNFNYMLGMETDEAFEARRPHVETWDVEQSPPVRIFMLIEDPEGTIENVGLSSMAGKTDIEILQNQVAVLTQHLARLTEMQLHQAQVATTNRPDGQTIIPSNDTGPNTPVPVQQFGPSAEIPVDEQGRIITQSATIAATDIQYTPEQVALIQAQQQAALIAETAALYSDPMAQFAKQGLSDYPDDTLDDINRIPPPPIPAFPQDAMGDETLGDLELISVGGGMAQDLAPSATVDAPPTVGQAAPRLAPRPGH